ncbi:pre-peptidase C-terminal domain-containing protein [Thalassotalea euphylliae]|uniref:Peptidase n=1 Tax=Thalassotalea euphylliae TaxID=1655234 RepID=A0A3E0UBJ6_9GAMM|nr:pre-peptidase C-terminal domain-containing protein [Thalassotalea euphylliae]REL34239.1 peptidase [Thalassotalea euphylliae]
MTGRTYFHSSIVSISLFLLTACGGGSDSSGESVQTQTVVTPSTKTYSVTVIDGYLKFATVWLDVNGNGVKDDDEPSAISQDRGIANLEVPSNINPENHSVLAYAEAGRTFDESLNTTISQSYVLATPKGETVVTPITTLIYIQANESASIETAKSQVGLALNMVAENLYQDFIANKHTGLTNAAADLVRLSIMPTSEQELSEMLVAPSMVIELVKTYAKIAASGENGTRVIRDSKQQLAGDTDLDGIADTDDSDIDGDNVTNDQDAFPYLASEWQDLDGDGIGNNSDSDIDGDNVENSRDKFPLDGGESEDLDGDGIGDNSDSDIDGDGINNEQDNDPFEADFNTLKNPGNVIVDETLAGSIVRNEWQYFTVEAPAEVMLNIQLSNLSDDVDLYVGESEFPTKFDYLCRSNMSSSTDEHCSIRTESAATYKIGLLARANSNFSLSATTAEVVYKRALLLLHGLASGPDTWNGMINDDSFFNGLCHTLTFDEEPLSVLGTNNDGISCFNLEFGALDRGSQYSATGLDGKTCNSVLGCDGDYTTFEGLGFEVEAAITRITEYLGQDVEIFLFGHSRGGLAARSYLQHSDTRLKSLVKGFATTGTPHQGSPLGRFYQYMQDNCVPESLYRQDGSKCEDNWELVELLDGTREFFGYPVGEYLLDLQAPSIHFLSPESEAINRSNETLAELNELIIGQLAYEGTRFGLLAKDVVFLFDYDLYRYQIGIGDHPHPDTLRYVENGQSREFYVGDGIVPAFSQKLSLLLALEGIDINRARTQTAENILHTEETQQVSDIHWLFEGLFQALEWN